MNVELMITGRVESLHLEPGDRVLVTLDDPRRITPSEIDGLHARVKEHFPDHDVLILNGIQIARGIA